MTEQIGKVILELSHYPGEDFYCDGAAEDVLLDITKNYSSVEYAKLVEERAEWPLLYHLSPLRENMVSWIPMEEGCRVLEIGSGCGAITGALAKKAGELTCVDLSKKRSLINAYRHSEAKNVTIHVGNFKDIEPDLPVNYDFIFLIGVFEYGQSYMEGEKPFRSFLEIVRKHLKPGGRIIMAIENKYGLKYFAGCMEDHLGTYFSGIENYADGGGVRTFSRRGLEKLFAESGIEEYHFYYPYPDYKFMTNLYSDEYLPKKGELSDNLRNFDRDRMLLFDEKNAFDGITEDGLFPVFSNSFCVVLGGDFPVRYVKYSNDRAAEFRIRTEIYLNEEGRKIVKKLPLSEEGAEHIRGMAVAYDKLFKRYEGGGLCIEPCTLKEEGKLPLCEFPYAEGTPLSELLDACLEKNDTEKFHMLFKEYIEKIGYHADYPVADYDLAFNNILVKGDTWTVIDYEWTFGKVVETKELAFRAVYCYLLENEKRNKLNLDLILEELDISPADAERFREKERDFQKFVTGKRLSMAEMRDCIGKRVQRPQMWLEKLENGSRVRRVQVYEDTGSDFTEEKSYFVPDAYQGEQDAELQIPVSGEVKRLRIDPSLCPCAVNIRELTFNGVPVPLRNRKVFQTNGKYYRPEQGILYATEDPWFVINLEELPAAGGHVPAQNLVYLKMEMAELPQALAEALALSVKKVF